MTDETTAEPVVEPVEAVAAVEPAPEPETSEVEQPESDDDGDDESDLQDGKHRGKSAKSRIAELTRKFRETERELALVKGLVSQPTQDSLPESAAKPVLDDFESYDAYNEALVEWKVDQRLAKASTESAARTGETLRQAEWASKLEAAQSILPDYAEVVGKSDIQIAPHVGEALMESDRGPELAYHMAQHPEVAARLNTMSPAKAAIELGRLETALSAPAVRSPTKAPPPIAPLRSAPARQTDLAKASMDDYIEMRRKMGARY